MTTPYTLVDAIAAADLLGLNRAWIRHRNGRTAIRISSGDWRLFVYAIAGDGFSLHWYAVNAAAARDEYGVWGCTADAVATLTALQDPDHPAPPRAR